MVEIGEVKGEDVKVGGELRVGVVDHLVEVGRTCLMEVVARMEGSSCHRLCRVGQAWLMEVVARMEGPSTLVTAFVGWESLAIHPLLCKGGLQETPYPRDPRPSL